MALAFKAFNLCGGQHITKFMASTGFDEDVPGAKAGDPDAMLQTAFVHIQLRKNMEKAVSYVKMAADRGNAMAQYV